MLDWSSLYCPRQQVTAWSWHMLQLAAGYRDGFLPIAGGLADQPYRLLRAFSIIAERQAFNADKRAKRGKKTQGNLRDHRRG